MRAAAIVVAGGRGVRIGGDVPKQYLEIRGVPVLLRAVRAFLTHPGIASVVAVLPPDDVAAPPAWLDGLRLRVVAGGAERGDSVWNGLAALPEEVEQVLVHDGARPFVTHAEIDRVLAASVDGGAIAAMALTDTVKEVAPDGRILGTADRTRLWRAQTPQGFPRAGLVRAYEQARREGFAATDDAAIYERYAGTVRVVEGSSRNIKVTVPEDLALGEWLALAAPAATGE